MEREKETIRSQFARPNMLSFRATRRKVTNINLEVYSQLVNIIRANKQSKINVNKVKPRKLQILSASNFKNFKKRVLAPNVRKMFEDLQIKGKNDGNKLTPSTNDKLFISLQ